jgi:hypothetical protein
MPHFVLPAFYSVVPGVSGKGINFFGRVISSWVAFDDRDLRIFPNYSNNSMNLFFFFLDSTLFRICNYGYWE